MSILIDRRCPRCNRIVRGREEVAIMKSTLADEKIDACPHCKVRIKLVKGEKLSPNINLIEPDNFYFDVVT